MPTIDTVQGIATEIVLQERLTTNEFRVVEIHEEIEGRSVRVLVEMGPFTTETRPNGETVMRGRGRRNVEVWRDAEYDAVRDTWGNVELLAAVKAKLES